MPAEYLIYSLTQMPPYLLLHRQVEKGRWIAQPFNFSYHEFLVPFVVLIITIERKLKENLKNEEMRKKMREILGKEPNKNNLRSLILGVFFEAYFTGKLDKADQLITFTFPGAKLEELDDLEKFVKKYCLTSKK